MEWRWSMGLSKQIEKPLVITAIILAFIALLSVSCTSPASPGQVPGGPTVQPETDPNNSGTATPAANSGDQGEQDPDRIYPTLPEGIERIEDTYQAPVTGEVPVHLLASILEDLSGHQGIDVQQIEVVRAEAVTWPDGSLGCPKPGEFYTQEPVLGYWIVLQVNAITYDYRASEGGYFTFCEQPLPLPLPGSPDK
jgi:hypothetical protein